MLRGFRVWGLGFGVSGLGSEGAVSGWLLGDPPPKLSGSTPPVFGKP